MRPARVALRHVRGEMNFERARVVGVRATPAATFIVRVSARDPVADARWTFGVRVGRRGEVLEDDLTLPAAEGEGR